MFLPLTGEGYCKGLIVRSKFQVGYSRIDYDLDIQWAVSTAGWRKRIYIVITKVCYKLAI